MFTLISRSAASISLSAINMLLNKGKQTISGVNRTGRLAVLAYMGMLLALYAVALARILQLSRSVI